ncbi:YgiW/YdeI family stress tolerance OB fold protein [Ursidibacter arcticus]
MKKLAVISIVASILGLTACNNNSTHHQQTFGANTPSQTISIKQALSARDDSYVTIEGRILSQIDNDEYIIADESGQIRVEIDNHIWRGQNVSSQDKVRLYGEIDNEWNKTELKVRELTIVK